jgi:predicted small lipoprotein YifL
MPALINTGKAGLPMKKCWANTLLGIVIVILGIGSMLSACGRKGDLYLVDDQKQETKKKDKEQR